MSQNKKETNTLKATWDLLVFFNLIALLTCLPGSSSQKYNTKHNQTTRNSSRFTTLKTKKIQNPILEVKLFFFFFLAKKSQNGQNKKKSQEGWSKTTTYLGSRGCLKGQGGAFGEVGVAIEQRTTPFWVAALDWTAPPRVGRSDSRCYYE